MDSLRHLIQSLPEAGFCKAGPDTLPVRLHAGGPILTKAKGEQLEILEHHGEDGDVLSVVIFADIDAV